jgi:broad specificity phosphatase PhoE
VPAFKEKLPGKMGSKTAAIPGDVEIHFLNGSKVRMLVQSEKLEISTNYGKLAVPVKDIRSIEFGLHYPDDMETKIEGAIKSLGATDYREREKANALLIDLGPYSYPAVLQANRAKELPEVAKRAKEVVAKLQAKHPKKDLKTTTDDRVVTTHFTIVGRIMTTTVKAKTEYFGEQELNLAKMRTLRAMGGASLDTELTIDSGKYANAGQWLDTNFQVDGQTPITIIASGLIDVWPQQGGGFMSGPAGFQQTRNGGGNGAMMKGGRKIGPILNAQQHCGMLLAKIGEDGEMFIVGDRYDGTPETEGKLFLHIGPSQWNAQCIGNYDVKISTRND